MLTCFSCFQYLYLRQIPLPLFPSWPLTQTPPPLPHLCSHRNSQTHWGTAGKVIHVTTKYNDYPVIDSILIQKTMTTNYKFILKVEKSFKYEPGSFITLPLKCSCDVINKQCVLPHQQVGICPVGSTWWWCYLATTPVQCPRGPACTPDPLPRTACLPVTIYKYCSKVTTVYPALVVICIKHTSALTCQPAFFQKSLLISTCLKQPLVIILVTVFTGIV